MRLIDADALVIDFYDDYETKDDEYTYAYVSEVQIDSAPSIDIVRCSECKWRKADNSCDLNCRIEYLDGTETDMWFYVKPDDFCSYGCRKEE